MEHITIGELAAKWGVSATYIRKLCSREEIPGAIMRDGMWMVPEESVRVKRTKMEHTEEPELPELAKKLKNQKKKRNFHGLYDFVMIDFTYSSSRMASCRLTRKQVESIYRKGKVKESFEPMKVSDLIEVLNHFHCIDYILDHVMEPLTQKFIRKLHQLLMAGSVDAYMERVRPGEYRTITSQKRAWEFVPANDINPRMNSLIQRYESQCEIERNQILDFHVRFEEIFPFEDGNGRVGRLILFKECLRHEIMPFIIDDKRRGRYLQGIKEWHEDHFEMIDMVMEAQERFEKQIELQKLHAAAQLHFPEGYQEDLIHKNE